MGTIFIVILVILFLLAISDLIVGVSNDAVNFLVSAVGSKVATWGVIILVASLGVLFGATFSSGMMEVARKGIFHPQMFTFTEIMYVFLAVMFTDIILLDTFNTLGLPTSTTVSIVFELLGAAIGIAVMKISHGAEGTIGDFINSGRALAIIIGILVSVVVAFTVGLLIQFIVRLTFTFKYEKLLRYFGALWGGLSFTAITYFMVIKGVKGASFMTPESVQWLTNNTVLILSLSFVIWTIILQLLLSLFKVKILNIIVLLGTFALAMAFAGNDLVNFIGVPLAGLESFKIFHASGSNPDILMSALAGKVKTPTLYLLIAGLIMVITLWLSKKARSVIKTSVNLSRQDKGYERFGSTGLARVLVRVNVQMANKVTAAMPASVSNWISSRFETVESQLKEEERPAFDLIRASTNLVVSAVLIAIGTSFKLPLSTTYVTFMVAMGTSLADGAWGRESAVFRVTGVFSVIGGWFITALIASTIAFIFAMIIYFGGIYSISLIAILAIVLVYRTQFIHKKRVEEEKILEEEFAKVTEDGNTDSFIKQYNSKTVAILNKTASILENTFKGLKNEDRKLLNKQFKKMKEIDSETKAYKVQMHEIVRVTNDAETENVHYFVQMIDYLREIAHALSFIVEPAFNHINNNHQGLSGKQYAELSILYKHINEYIGIITEILQNIDFSRMEELKTMQENILDNIFESRKQQLKRIKSKDDKVKSSLLFLDILAELKNLSLFTMSFTKTEREYRTKLGQN